jgi:putative ABC transport system permease protein
MLLKHIKIFFRHLVKNKIYSILNIMGLALGMAVCIHIYLYLSYELSFDNYHKDLDRIYRVVVKSELATSSSSSATICAPVAQVLKDNFPQVEEIGMVIPVSKGLVKYENKMFYEGNRMYANNGFLNILTIPFIKGDQKTALNRPATAVISKRMANKYFGDKEALGQLININRTDYEITGIVENSPINTHFKFDFFLSLKTLEGRYPFERWFLSNFYIYTKLKSNVDYLEFSNQLAQLADNYAPGNLIEADETVTYYTQPVANIHINSQLRNEKEPGFNKYNLYIFSAIGLLVLVIAVINFINLSTARSVIRSKEVGIRKVIGAKRHQLMFQFIVESVFITLFAASLAILLVDITLPILNSIIDSEISMSTLYNPLQIMILVAIVLIIGILSGGYPAFVLSSYQLVSTFKEVFINGLQGATFRRSLVIGQFVVSIILIVGTLIVYQQLNFMKNKPLGFDSKQKLILPVRDNSVAEKYDFIKNEFTKHSSVTGATLSSEVPGKSTDRWDTILIGASEKISRTLNYIYVGFNFLDEYNIRLIEGRKFKSELFTDINSSYIMNIAAVKEFGWKTPAEALGKKVQGIGQPGEIVGVIEDFHYRGLQSEIEPLIMKVYPSRFRYLTLTINTSNLQEVLSVTKAKWIDIFPEYPFEFSFLNEDFNRQYRYEEQFGDLFGLFTFIGLFIACLGLLGLSSFIVNQKTKEIGIRKVLGASVLNIIFQLNKSFTFWVLISNVIAWPFAWLSMNYWLQNFAYRIDIDWYVFLLAGSVALVIALITVTSQVIKAAIANPIESLRYE